MIIDVLIKDEEGRTLDKLTAKEKTFSSGSKGFFGQSKIEIDGKRYQTQIQMVEIGSKEKAKE